MSRRQGKDVSERGLTEAGEERERRNQHRKGKEEVKEEEGGRENRMTRMGKDVAERGGKKADRREGDGRNEQARKRSERERKMRSERERIGTRRVRPALRRLLWCCHRCPSPFGCRIYI